MNLTLPNADIWPAMVQGSEQWFAARRGRATASQFKKILTPGGKLSKQAEAYARQLARETIMTDPQEFTGNKFTDWGNEHEPAAREAWQELTGTTVHEIGFATHQRMRCVGCSPDGLVEVGGKIVAGLEIKCPQIDTLVDWALAGVIPPDHMAQVHGSMIVTGLKRWEFCAYHPGAPLFTPPAAEWNSFTDALLEAVEGFVVLYSEIRPRVVEILRPGSVKPAKKSKPVGSLI